MTIYRVKLVNGDIFHTTVRVSGFDTRFTTWAPALRDLWEVDLSFSADDARARFKQDPLPKEIREVEFIHRNIMWVQEFVE